MPDITHDQAHEAVRTALNSVTGLEPDRLLFGNRESSWTRTQRNYRLNPAAFEDAGTYRNNVRTRINETLIIHLTHRVAADPDRSESQAGRDAESVVQALRSDNGLRTLGVRPVWAGTDRAESEGGDHIETDVTFELTYDLSLTLTAG